MMEQSEQKPPHILIVDDMPANVLLLEKMLATRGYRTRAVISGALALRAARMEPPDLILLDINMPEMDGYELCRQIKADELLAEIPIIFMSARHEPMDKVKAFRLGGADYVTKPFQLEEVYARVETHLRICSQQRRLSHQNEDMKRLLEEIRNTRTYAESIVETVREPLLVLDADLKIVTANHSFYATFRVTSQETVGNFIYDLGNRQWDIPPLRLLLEDILPHETLFNGYEVEHEFPEIGKKTMLLNAREIFRKGAGSHIILLAMEDITLRKELEAEMDAREYAENIVETVREPLLVLDAGLKIVTANQSFYATFRVTSQETLGKFIYDLGNRQWNIPALRLLLEDILPHETLFNCYEVEQEFPEIGKKTMLLNARQIFRKKIGSHIILLAMEDITRRKEIQEELLLKDQALMRSEKMASIGQLAAGVAHEINNPMGYISSNLAVLTDYFHQIVRFDRFRRDLDAGDSSTPNLDAVAARRVELEIDSIFEDGVDLIGGTLRGAKRVMKIVQDLKQYARIDPLEKEAITLDRCLESALAICNTQLKYVAVIRKEYEPTPKVFCNQGQLNQVFLNLLVNAGHAITAPGEIVLKSRFDGFFVYVSVSDNGIGIPEEIRKRIFDPFFSTKDVGKGTGLGLSISSQIIKKHGGELLVESMVGVGTTFTVKLPIPLDTME